MTDEERRRKRADYMRAYTAANAERINAQRRDRRKQTDYLSRERAWRQRNKAKVLAYKKADREKNPEAYRRWKKEWATRNAESIAAKKKAIYDANRDKEIERRRAHYRKNRKAQMARIAAWANANPEKVREIQSSCQAKRRAQRLATEVTPISRRSIYERDNHRCGICRKVVRWRDFHLDHIVPLSRGGAHVESNVQTAHSWCNVRKGNRGTLQPRLVL